MASIHKETVIAAPPEKIWDAVRDVGEIHRRLVPGFVVDCKLEGGSRLITLFNGLTVREFILDVNDERKRHAWNVVADGFEHYNASLQLFPEGNGQTRVVWIVDLLPHELAETISGLVEQGLATMKHHLEQVAAA